MSHLARNTEGPPVIAEGGEAKNVGELASRKPFWVERWGFDLAYQRVVGEGLNRTMRVPSDFFCSSCLGVLAGSAIDFACCHCGHPVAAVAPAGCIQDRVCGACRSEGEKQAFENVIVVGRYADVLREAVIAAKQSHAGPLAMGLGNLLAWRCRALHPESWRPDIVTCVPSHWTRRFQRRSWPTQWLAAELGASLGVPVRNLLRMVRRTKKQGMLSDVERRDNVEGAFMLRRALPKHVRRVLIVDDVWTTGSTMRAAAAVIKGESSEVRVAGGIVARAVGNHRISDGNHRG